MRHDGNEYSDLMQNGILKISRQLRPAGLKSFSACDLFSAGLDRKPDIEDDD
jgi:hypothetical protein